MSFLSSFLRSDAFGSGFRIVVRSSIFRWVDAGGSCGLVIFFSGGNGEKF